MNQARSHGVDFFRGPSLAPRLLLPGGIFPWLRGGLGSRHTPPTPQFPVGSYSCTQWGWLHQMFQPSDGEGRKGWDLKNKRQAKETLKDRLGEGFWWFGWFMRSFVGMEDLGLGFGGSLPVLPAGPSLKAPCCVLALGPGTLSTQDVLPHRKCQNPIAGCSPMFLGSHCL